MLLPLFSVHQITASKDDDKRIRDGDIVGARAAGGGLCVLGPMALLFSGPWTWASDRLVLGFHSYGSGKRKRLPKKGTKKMLNVLFSPLCVFFFLFFYYYFFFMVQKLVFFLIMPKLQLLCKIMQIRNLFRK